MRQIEKGYVTYQPLKTEQEKADAVKDILHISIAYQEQVRRVCKVENGAPLQDSINEDIAVLETIYDAICNKLDWIVSEHHIRVKTFVDTTWSYCRTRHVEDHTWSLKDFKNFCERYINTPYYDLYKDLDEHSLVYPAAYLATYLKDAFNVVYNALDRRLNDEAPLL